MVTISQRELHGPSDHAWPVYYLQTEGENVDVDKEGVERGKKKSNSESELHEFSDLSGSLICTHQLQLGN